MENKQIFMFFADVVALAARHFGESPQAAPAEPRPPESPADPATAAPPTDARKAEVEREQDLMGSFASELASVLDEDEDGDDVIAGVQHPRQTPRNHHAPTTAARVGHVGLLGGIADVDEFVSQLKKISLLLADERAANQRLRAELAESQRALEAARDALTRTQAEVLRCAAPAERREVAEQDRHRPTAGEVLRRFELGLEHDARTDARPGSAAEFLLHALATLAGCKPPPGRPSRGRDIEAQLEIDFSQMVRGATVPLVVDGDGEPRTVDVVVPTGIADDSILTLPAQGGAGDPPGDLLVRVRVVPDLLFTRDGNNITMRAPVPPESLARKKLSVEAPTGSLTVSITAEHLGHTLRCKGKGIAPEGQEAGDLLITLDPGPVLAATIDQFSSATTAFDALRSLCPGARAHLANLMGWAEHASDRQDIRDVVWALAVAHERGLRTPISGFAAPLVGELVKNGSLRSSASWRSRRCHVFAWMDGKSSLVTRERLPRASGVLWTVHLERLGDERHWSRIESDAVVTHRPTPSYEEIR